MPHSSKKKKNLDSNFELPVSFLGVQNIIINYLLADIQKRSRSFKIGLMTITLVTAFVVVLDSLISLAPQIFFRVSQYYVGDFDVTLTKRGDQ